MSAPYPFPSFYPNESYQSLPRAASGPTNKVTQNLNSAGRWQDEAGLLGREWGGLDHREVSSEPALRDKNSSQSH